MRNFFSNRGNVFVFEQNIWQFISIAQRVVQKDHPLQNVWNIYYLFFCFVLFCYFGLYLNYRLIELVFNESIVRDILTVIRQDNPPQTFKINTYICSKANNFLLSRYRDVNKFIKFSGVSVKFLWLYTIFWRWKYIQLSKLNVHIWYVKPAWVTEIVIPDLDRVIIRKSLKENVLNISPRIICGFLERCRKSTVTHFS